MKKSILTILTALYLFSTTGANLEVHYCMGRMADWSIGHDSSETCGRCGMEKSDEQTNGCCSDEEAFYKNTADQKPGANAVFFVPLPVAQKPNHAPVFSFSFNTLNVGSVFEHAPLRCCSLSRHVLNSVFRI